MLGSAEQVRTNSSMMDSYGFLLMDTSVLADYQKLYLSALCRHLMLSRGLTWYGQMARECLGNLAYLHDEDRISNVWLKQNNYFSKMNNFVIFFLFWSLEI